jgi:DNA modification methylase
LKKKSMLTPTIQMPERIELWPLDRLFASDRRARIHSDTQINQIVSSIEEFGFTNPILVNSEGRIIVGYARFIAATKGKLSHVPVVILSHLSEAQQRAYRIADNQLALNASWDEEVLKQELEALIKEAFSIDLLGFGEEELKRLNASPELQIGLADEDLVPALADCSVSRLGDVWVLGRHRLLCGDSTELETIRRFLLGQEAAMTFTDPPYNVAYQGKSKQKLLNDDLGSEFLPFLQKACRSIVESTAGAIYMAMSSSQLHTLAKAFLEAGGHFSTFVIWTKDQFTLGRSDYHRQFEPLLYGWREGAKRYWCGDRKQGDVWCYPKPRANDLHPTMKPVGLVERAILNSSQRNDVVLDPFAGAGSTAIACQKTARQARMVELDPRYVDVIVRRWQDFTGLAAVLEAGGRSFAQIAEDRLNCADADKVAQ